MNQSGAWITDADQVKHLFFYYWSSLYMSSPENGTVHEDAKNHLFSFIASIASDQQRELLNAPFIEQELFHTVHIWLKTKLLAGMACSRNFISVFGLILVSI